MEQVLEWILENMLKKNEKDQGCYSELIYLCGKVQNVQFALQVFSLMEGHGVRPTSAVFNSLICACLCSNHVTTALSSFEIMQRSLNYKPNLVTYNAFISMYSKLGDVTSMRVWYSASTKAGFPPTVQTFEYLISGSVKSQEIDIADKFYEEMLLLDITPNMSILENMLEGLCQQKKLSKIKEFLNFILDGGWNVNVHMVTKLVGLYSSVGKVEDMEELLLTLTRTNQDSKVLSHTHCGIIRMYALSDRLDDMEFSIGRMLKQGMSFTCADDVEKVICSYFRRGAYERLELFLERIQGSYKLARSTYDLLVSGYRRAGMSYKLDSVVKEMRLGEFSVA
ncbi:Pentatricopeptide repeat-containing protein [Thalictrum thalictroides]|uniref:Pentatricopeptide repeat-containing protein n=1 Tax=Thalictrum thalictroides TaxID=46969 RepID=A0A7J6VRD7_THATH|nr:Pentatricopeptide repeat-containing protein [Thalictrum thalictroides]